MPDPREGRRALRLEVGFEAGRSGQGALGRAYEHLLPLSARPISPGLRAPRKEAHHGVPSPEGRAAAGAAAGGDLRQGCLIAPPLVKRFLSSPPGLGMTFCRFRVVFAVRATPLPHDGFRERTSQCLRARSSGRSGHIVLVLTTSRQGRPLPPGGRNSRSRSYIVTRPPHQAARPGTPHPSTTSRAG
jgi:hypothetical protein